MPLWRNSYLEIISLFGPTVLTIVMNHHHTRDARLTLEANGAIAARATGGDSGGNNVYVTLKTQLELQTILCTEYRYVWSSTPYPIPAFISPIKGTHISLS